MRLKVRHYLLSFFFLFPISLFAQIKDSIVEVMVSNSLEVDETSGSMQINEMPYPFFDTNATQLYFYVETTSLPKDSGIFIIVELKKKSNMQFKFKSD